MAVTLGSVRRLGGHGGLPVVCVPHAGAGVSAFATFARALPVDLEIYGLQAPGREDRLAEQHPGALVALAATLAGEVSAAITPPYVILGHSLGALLGWELSRLLPNPPVLLVASGCLPPNKAAGGERGGLDDDALIDRMTRLGGMPDVMRTRPEVLRLFLPVLRADLASVRAYRYVATPTPSFPILVLGGDGDPAAPPDRLAGWRIATSGRVEVRSIPGGHFGILNNPSTVAEHLLEALVAL